MDKDADNTLTVVSEKASVEGIKMKPGEEQLIKVTFTPFESSAKDKKNYNFDVIQFNWNGKKWVEIGGVRFEIRPPLTTITDSARQQ